MDIIQLKGKYERIDKNKGYERTYEFNDEDGKIHWSCDVYGECIKAPIVYKCATDEDNHFKMSAKGKFLDATEAEF